MERRCPVCDQTLSRQEWIESPGGIVEEVEECHRGHYYYEFSYGANRLTIGDDQWVWSTGTDTDDAWRMRKKEMDEVVKRHQKVGWLFETDVFDEGISRLVDEVKRQGMEAHIASYLNNQPGVSEASYLDLFPPHSCVVFYGSLNFAKQVRREATWLPAPYDEGPAHRCVTYYPPLGEHLLAQDYTMLPYGELRRMKKKLYKRHGLSETLFIRPDSGNKIFTGQLVYAESFEKSLDRMGFYEVPSSELVVVSEPRVIKAEWRFVVADHRVIAGSQYRRNNEKEVSPIVDDRAWELAEKVAAEGFQPDRVWTMDICRSGADHYYLLEIGCFSCAGLYACEAEPIVREVSRIALEEWKESQ